jgi:hypothetical protein
MNFSRAGAITMTKPSTTTQTRELEPGERTVLSLATERVAQAARRFCEEVQEDAEGVPHLQLADLNEALDAWEAYPAARKSYDDSQPVLAALASLVEDPHATDHQRRIAHLALAAMQRRKDTSLNQSERDDLCRAIAESNITDGLLENEDIDALVDLFEAWLERRAPSTTTEQVIRLREALEPQPRLLTVEALEAVTNYFWSADSPVLSEAEVQELVEAALKAIKANTLDGGTLEWCAQWVLDSLTGETNERVVEFANNMAMTFRAALQPKAETEGEQENHMTTDSNSEYRPLKERIEAAFKRHVETDNGMIVGPDRLLEKVLRAVSAWLQYDEQQWGDVESCVSEALRDLRTSQMR